MNQKLKVTLSIILLSFPWTQSSAEECNDWAQGSTMWEGCLLNKETTILESKLNEVYEKLISRYSKIPPYQEKKLIEAQIAWVNFRQKTCDFENTGANGIGYARCSYNLTKERVSYLEQFL